MITSAPNDRVAKAGSTTELAVNGMTCGNCARRVREAIQSVPGVTNATVDLPAARARVRWEPDASPDVDAVAAAVRRAGYGAVALSAPAITTLTVTGMTCIGCVRHVSEALQAVPGVDRAEVKLEEAQATVHWKSPPERNDEALVAAVTQAGYAAEAAAPARAVHPARSWSPLTGWRFNVVVGVILSAPLFILEWGFQVGQERWYHWLAFALVLPIQTLCGARFYRGAWGQLKVGRSNMDTLVVLGSTTAFLYSVWGLLARWPGHLFFMESAAILTLISVGHWTESKISARAASSLRALLNLTPATARLLLSGGQEQEVAVTRLRLGDRIVLKPGDRVPTDGEVLEGTSSVDEGMLTGESMPAEKAPGSRVYGGTVNQNGRLIVNVTATGESTALAQIIAVVQRAQNSRANIQRLGDHVSSVFVPVVVLIAVATGLWWGLAPESARLASDWLGHYLWPAHHPEGALAAAVYHAAAVLIIACPCAMGLATPVAIMAGTNVAAEHGILIRDGTALEKSGRLTGVVFDKTGTLTEGKLAVVATQNFAEVSTWQKMAASLARPSLHPLSQAVTKLSDDTSPVCDWEEIRGSGIRGKIEAGEQSGAPTIGLEAPSSLEQTLRLGSLAWLRESGIDVSSGTLFANEWTRQGTTVLGFSVDQRLCGALALQDTLKPAAVEVINQLAKQGKRVYLVTGDNKVTAEAIARRAGIAPENVFAEVRPEAKAATVKQLQARGERLAFIGDGINDAPALEQADLGIAVARASDIAREAADVILLKSDIHAVPESLELAQATLRTIKQNLFWAFFYNAAAVPLAVLGFMSPVLSALAMGLSDLLVIGNALRLRRWRLPRA